MYYLVINRYIATHHNYMDFREFSFFTNQVALDGEVHDYNSFHNQNEMYETDLM